MIPPLPVITCVTLALPCVSVPVLSVNKICMPPAASMPAARFTNTLSFAIFVRFDESTTAIIMGNPSGTATTTTAIASVSACVRRANRVTGLAKSAFASAKFMPLSIKNALIRSAIATRTAAA